MSHSIESQSAPTLASRYAHETSFFFSSPEVGLLTRGAGETLRSHGEPDVSRAAERALHSARQRGAAGSIVAGALPFDVDAAPSLRLHTNVEWREPDGVDLTSRASSRASVRTSRVTMQPSPSDYLQGVSRVLERIEQGGLHKVVLARSLDLELGVTPDLRELLRRLSEQNRGKYVFSCELPPASATRRVLLGASPELLVRKRGRDVSSHPLAGSVPRGSDPVQDAERARTLAECPKSRREHRFVVDAVAAALWPHCSDLHVPAEPALVPTAAMWHLGSKIVGRLRERDLSSLALAVALHPTPAVCGVPMDRARASIAELERFDRGFFAGAVGYCDSQGDGEWAVTIRCAEAQGNRLRLYAGAGIVAASTPASELDETTAKLNTMLRALGISDLRQVL